MLGVALVRELRQRGWFAQRREPDLMGLLDLVALGTDWSLQGVCQGGAWIKQPRGL